MVKVWARVDDLVETKAGTIEVGFRRRFDPPGGEFSAGEILSLATFDIAASDWQRLEASLELDVDRCDPAEPIDLYLRWIPETVGTDLLVDRMSVMAGDAEDGLDASIIQITRDSLVSHLRWPGGNFVNNYHWRDGVGQVEDRATRRNPDWGGIDQGLIGTDEFLRFCELTQTKPHLVVNSGTGTPEEAAAWVEYCNGAIDTPFGSMRTANGHPMPYGIQFWEIGNESYGSWQGGFSGSDENARRFRRFVDAMRAASPTPITIMACGNAFDFVEPGPAYDNVVADKRWHDQLLDQAADDIDYISLHSLPVNDFLLESLTDSEAHEAVLAQVTTWERRFIPDLLERCDVARPGSDRDAIKLAITEWGPLGEHPNRLMVENFGGAVYAGTFLNFLIRNAMRVDVASPNGFMHGGCIRKVGGLIYTDPQFDVIQKYRSHVGGTVLGCEVTGRGYDVPHGADLGAADTDIPYIDAAACRSADGRSILVAVANRHLHDKITLDLGLSEEAVVGDVRVEYLAHPQITARTNPARPNPFLVTEMSVTPVDGRIVVSVEPFSCSWITVPISHHE